MRRALHRGLREQGGIEKEEVEGGGAADDFVGMRRVGLLPSPPFQHEAPRALLPRHTRPAIGRRTPRAFWPVADSAALGASTYDRPPTCWDATSEVDPCMEVSPRGMHGCWPAALFFFFF